MESEIIRQLAKRTGMSVDEVARLRALPLAEIEKLIHTYCYAATPGIAEYHAGALRDLVVPQLIDVLNRDDAFETIPGNPANQTPGGRALFLIDPGENEALKEPLRKWVASGNERALLRIATHVTAYGSDDLLPEIRLLFEHPDRMIASSARGGALAPLKSGRAEPGFTRYVWDHCAGLLNTPDAPEAYDPIRLLILIDQDRTRELLQASETLRPDHPLLPAILSTLKKLDSPPSSELVIHLMDSKGQRNENRQQAADRVAFSILLGQGHPRANAFIEQVLAKPSAYDEMTVLSAWNGRFRLADRVPLYDLAFEEHITKGVPLEDLHPDHRAVFLLDELTSEIKNGGLDQWFFNGGGAHAKEVVTSLKRFGAKKHAKIIESAIGVFGLRGVPTDIEEMRKRMSKMDTAASAKLRDLDFRFEDLPWWRIVAAEWDWKRQ